MIQTSPYCSTRNLADQMFRNSAILEIANFCRLVRKNDQHPAKTLLLWPLILSQTIEHTPIWISSFCLNCIDLKLIQTFIRVKTVHDVYVLCTSPALLDTQIIFLHRFSILLLKIETCGPNALSLATFHDVLKYNGYLKSRN